MKEENIIIETTDNVLLSATLFTPKNPKKAVVISSATGAKKGFYFDFARFLCTKDAIVLTFDYRGIGDSKVEDLNASEIKMSDWAIKDLNAVLGWINAKFDFPIYLLGHSIGSQLLSVVENNHLIKKALFIGTNHGYWKNLPKKSHPKTLLFSLAISPFLSLFYDYLPLKKKGFGADLPSGVAKEFSKWILDKNYYFDLLGNELPDYRKGFKADTTILVFEDDELITLEGTQKFVEQAAIQNFNIEVFKASGDNKVGHFGMFRKKNEEVVWDKMSEIIL